MKRLSRFVAIAVATTLSLAACGGTSNTPNDSQNAIVKAEDAPATPTGTLRVAAVQEPSSMDPTLVDATSGPVIFPEYDTLTSSDQNAEAKPWLATEWSQPDPTTWTFKLRDDVVFHDGSKFDAETVKLNLDRAKTMTASPWGFIYAPITEVTVVDPTTVTIKFATPQPGFPFNMSQPAGAMISPKAIKEGTDLTRTAAGSGGWIWDSAAHIEGSKHVYHANPAYWNPDAVKVKTIEMSLISESTARLNAVQSGQADVMAYITAEQFDAAHGAGMNLVSSMCYVSVLGILDREGTLVPALADPKVREAMGYLIDRDGYNNAVLSGHGYPSNGFAAPDVWWHASALEKVIPHNVTKAKKLLAEAGYPDGFTFEVASSPNLKVRIEAIAQMLAEGGVIMKPVMSAQGQYTADIRKGKYPVAYLAPTSIDPYSWWGRTMSNNGVYNPFKLTDLADLEDDYNAAVTTTDEGTRVELMAKLQSEVMKRGVGISVGGFPLGSALSSKVHATKTPIFAPDDVAIRPFYLWVE